MLDPCHPKLLPNNSGKQVRGDGAERKETFRRWRGPRIPPDDRGHGLAGWRHNSGRACPIPHGAGVVPGGGDWPDCRRYRVFAVPADRTVDQHFLLRPLRGRLYQRSSQSSGAVGHSDSGHRRTDRRSHGEVWVIENQGTRHSRSHGSGAGPAPTGRRDERSPSPPPSRLEPAAPSAPKVPSFRPAAPWDRW